jgi:hypothetical protein
MTGNSKKTAFTVTNPNGDTFRLSLRGRNLWAMLRLIEAGKKGCTPIRQPAPRWSAYIHNLREMGVEIKTEIERHGGTFAGNHGVYILLAEAAIVLGGAA